MWPLFGIVILASPLLGQEGKKGPSISEYDESLFEIPGDVELMVSGDLKDYFNFFLLPVDEQRKLYYKDEGAKVSLADVHKPMTLPTRRRKRPRGRARGKPRKQFNHDLEDFNNAPNRRWMLWDSVPDSYKYFAFWYNTYYGQQDYVDKMIAHKDLEKVKKERLMNINLQFLIHARYKIGFALGTREKIRDNSLYMMGYLISKIRRFQYIQQNIAYIAHAQWRAANTRNFKLLLRTYAEMMRIDVDIKDLVNYVKNVDDEYESFCSSGGKCANQENDTVSNVTREPPPLPFD